MISSRPAPELAARQRDILGFDSLPALLAFGALLALLGFGPASLSGFWPSTYDFWPQALFLLLGAVGALFLALSPRARPRFETTAWLLLAFLGWNLLSTAASVYRHDSWLELSRIGGALAVFFATRALWTPQRAIWIVGAWAVGMAWVCLPALVDFVQTRNSRQFGPFYNPNLFANALAMTLPIAAILPLLVRRKWGSSFLVALSGAPFLICGAGLLVTASKGGFLAALIALLCTSLVIGRAKWAEIATFVRRNRVAVGVSALVLALLFAFLAARTIVPRLQQARGADDNSTMFRVFIWRSTLDMAQAKPLLGHGPASFPHVYARFAQTGYTRSAHQSWLQIAAESGIPALLLLLGAVVVALKNGLARIKTADWPLVAGCCGAVVALLLHGNVDSGFQTTSILIFLSVALAVLVSLNDSAPPQENFASRLNPFWLGATLLPALGGYQTQKAAAGQDASQLADQFARNGAPTVGVQKMQEAIALDPSSARLWSQLGQLQEASGGDGRAAFQTAIALQPTRAANWANLARAGERAGQSPAEVEKLYERAVENDPLGTRLRLERARWRLETKNGAAYDDLGFILALRDVPYGRYPALADWVNLDFARATVLLAPHLVTTGQKARAKRLVELALGDVERARHSQAGNEAILRAAGQATDLDANADLETVAAQLAGLQTQLS
ncbi:MAG: O-antigen ligase family protein [Armatimonadetes bacterium]|nr:O-antigen ligase family protein [Armatimonadota bacterium]